MNPLNERSFVEHCWVKVTNINCRILTLFSGRSFRAILLKGGLRGLAVSTKSLSNLGFVTDWG